MKEIKLQFSSNFNKDLPFDDVYKQTENNFFLEAELTLGELQMGWTLYNYHPANLQITFTHEGEHGVLHPESGQVNYSYVVDGVCLFELIYNRDEDGQFLGAELLAHESVPGKSSSDNQFHIGGMAPYELDALLYCLHNPTYKAEAVAE